MPKWEYLFVRCENPEGNEWLVRIVGTQEIKNWQRAGTAVEMTAFCNQKGDEGWELISAMPDTIATPGIMGSTVKESRFRLLFKRMKV